MATLIVKTRVMKKTVTPSAPQTQSVERMSSSVKTPPMSTLVNV